MKTPPFASLLLATASLVFAAGTPDSPAQLAAERLANDNARAAARQNDATSAETILVAVNRAQPNTTWWHAETAQRLMHLVLDVRGQASAPVCSTLVTRTFEHLAQADALATDSRHKATIRALTGLVHERFHGEHAAALASYRSAAQLDPANTNAAESADRLQRTLDDVARNARK